jgi:hypothetical protein
MIQDSNNYWEQLERLEKLIRASELKAGIIFSFHSLIIGIFLDKLEQFRPVFESSVVFVILSFLWMLNVLISVFYTFKCFKPQMELKYNKNVFFFKDAVYSFGSTKKYAKKLMEVCANEDDLCLQLSEQIHVESKIIDQKFLCVNRSIKFFGLSIIFVLLTLGYWLVTL